MEKNTRFSIIVRPFKIRYEQIIHFFKGKRTIGPLFLLI
ncbi:conserved hypothetical protein [Listeria monocytogenes FSL F2-208]|nr:conserved hypothetical protein [Listeria monocytogenes FSL F2-208]